MIARDLLGGPVVNNLPSNAEHMGLIPGQGTKIPHLQLKKLARHSEDPVQPENRNMIAKLDPNLCLALQSNKTITLVLCSLLDVQKSLYLISFLQANL